MKNILLAITTFIFSLFPSKTGTISGFGKILESPSPIATVLPVATILPTPTPTASPSPTPKPLTFKELNELYGPCVYLPTLMYHHIQTEESAKANKQTGLSVYTNIFNEQMNYLKQNNYNVLSPENLINFFNSNQPIPTKSILLTFDDAYEDFYTDAFPILRNLNFKATVFTPTGLINNPGYLNWNQISEMNASNIYFANHTWSHKNVLGKFSETQKEITTADLQLNERGLNSLKVFSYPYGSDNEQTQNFLSSINYQIAYTTRPGSTLCKKQRFDLPRIRIGSRSLKSYGL